MGRSLSYESLVAVVSVKRLGPYLKETHGSKELAARLYQWNGDVATALWPLITLLELAARNSMAVQLDHLCRMERPRARWYNHPTWWTPRQRAALAEAKRNASLRGPVTEGLVIANLAFGFWVSVLDPGHEHELWVPGLRLAFPGSPGDRHAVQGRFRDLNKLRNEIAHHDRLWKRDIAKAEESLLRAAHWLDPDLADWMAKNSKVMRVVARRPQLPPSERWIVPASRVSTV